jgi:hypothetical protein
MSTFIVGAFIVFPLPLYDGMVARVFARDDSGMPGKSTHCLLICVAITKYVCMVRRASAEHAVKCILNPSETKDYDYLPHFYSREFDVGWELYGETFGKPLTFGRPETQLGAYFVADGKVRCETEKGVDTHTHTHRERERERERERTHKENVNFALPTHT